MSDDHAAHAISAYQGRLAGIAPTPNIDRLANEGALFTNAFCTNSICMLPGQGAYHNPDFRVRGDKPWGQNLIHFKDKHVTDAITDLTLQWLKDDRDPSKPFFLMHHYKAPHDYFDNAKRYELYLRDSNIPEPETL